MGDPGQRTRQNFSFLICKMGLGSCIDSDLVPEFKQPLLLLDNTPIMQEQ